MDDRGVEQPVAPIPSRPRLRRGRRARLTALAVGGMLTASMCVAGGVAAGITAAATVSIDKVTYPATDPQDFDFDLSGAGLPADLDLDTDPASAATPSSIVLTLTSQELGQKVITESAIPGWTLTDIACSEGATDLASRTVTLQVDVGDAIKCTFFNASTEGASLTIAKVTDPGTDPQDFDFDLEGAGLPVDLDLDTDPSSGGTPDSMTFALTSDQLGEKWITETAVSGWTLTAITCNEGFTDLETRTANVGFDPGVHITCTFTNTRNAGQTDRPVPTQDQGGTAPTPPETAGRAPSTARPPAATGALLMAVLAVVVLVALRVPHRRRR